MNLKAIYGTPISLIGIGPKINAMSVRVDHTSLVYGLVHKSVELEGAYKVANWWYMLETVSESAGSQCFMFPTELDAIAAYWIANNVAGFGMTKAAMMISEIGIANIVHAIDAMSTDRPIAGLFKGTGIGAMGQSELAAELPKAPWYKELSSGKKGEPGVLDQLLALGYDKVVVSNLIKKLGKSATIGQLLAAMR